MLLDLDDVVAHRENEGLQPRMYPQLLKDVYHVATNSPNAHIQPLSDLLVAKALR